MNKADILVSGATGRTGGAAINATTTDQIKSDRTTKTILVTGGPLETLVVQPLSCCWNADTK
jgi:hypothetical protein